MSESKKWIGGVALIVAGAFVMINAMIDPRSQGEHAGAWLSLNSAFAIPLILLGLVWAAWRIRKG